MTVYELNRDLEIEFSYNIYRRSLLKTLKKLRRSWKYKDYVLMGNILTNMETFKEQKCFDDPFNKYGIKKVVDTYWKKYKKLYPQLRLTEKMQHEILVYPESLLNEINYPTEVSANNNGLNIKFTFDTDNLYDKYGEEHKGDVKSVIENIVKWKEYTGDTKPLPRMIYRGDEV